MRTITALFVGLGSIGTRHLKNLTNLCADRGWTLQADALRSDRAYRKGFDKARAERIMRENAGTQFDPQVVDALLRVMENRG